MKDLHRIVVCGVSIYMLAIEFGLSAQTKMNIVRLDPNSPDTAARINLLEPHVVIIERNQKNNCLGMEVLCQGIPVIVLDEDQRSISVLSKENILEDEISELTSIIENVNRKDDEPVGERITESEAL